MDFVNNILSTTDIRTEYMSLVELFERLGPVEMPNSPSSSRMKDTSFIREASRFVEAILLGLPMQPVYIDGTQYRWEIIEGEDRLMMLWDYLHHAFALHGTRFMIDTLENQYMDEIPMSLRDKLRYVKIPVCLLNPGMSNFARYSIYQYLHTPSSAIDKLRDFRQILPDAYDVLYEKYKRTLMNPAKHSIWRFSTVFNIYCDMALSLRLEQIQPWQRCEHIDSVLIEALEDIGWLQKLPEVEEAFYNIVVRRAGSSKRKLFVAVLTREKQLLLMYDSDDIVQHFNHAWIKMIREFGPSMEERCEEYNNRINYLIKYIRR